MIRRSNIRAMCIVSSEEDMERIGILLLSLFYKELNSSLGRGEKERSLLHPTIIPLILLQ
jgi:hypothetical protein